MVVAAAVVVAITGLVRINTNVMGLGLQELNRLEQGSGSRSVFAGAGVFVLASVTFSGAGVAFFPFGFSTTIWRLPSLLFGAGLQLLCGERRAAG